VLLSRRHAELRVSGGHILARDLGSTNGTRLNGSPLGRDAVEVFVGDSLHVGPFSFLVGISSDAPRAIGDDQIVGWLGPDDGEEGVPNAASSTTVVDVPSSSRKAKLEVIQDVLVITPIAPDFMNAADPTDLRDELSDLVEVDAPRRVVLNLEHASRVSNAAVGVLVAHHLRLEAMGGSLRLCQPHARVAQVLEQIRLPLLLDVFPTKEDAVLSPWGQGEREAG
jgi:anti-anti-sigma factor